ncbi:beta-glucosidase [Caulobacter sp. UNC279MFTsu5.1]|nr:beta-glucosidase [Caulobacter sp. UNC279MFTsu5.1]
MDCCWGANILSADRRRPGRALRLRLCKAAAAGVLALGLAFPMAGSAAAAALPTPAGCAAEACLYLDPAASPEARAKDLIGRLTLEEKVAQMMDHAPGVPRLSVPPYGWWNEVLHGVARAGHATVFPQAIALSATWDTRLMFETGRAIAIEGRAKHNAAFTPEGGTDRYFGMNYWTPNINIFRDPRWGRGQETYGEDPFLTGSMAQAFIGGVQGDDPEHPLAIATPKHFAVHSGPEPLRHGFNVDPSPHDLEDTYLPAFRTALVDAKAGSVMCAYNAVYGEPACGSQLLLRDRLRKDWGFKGFVVSDCDSIDDMVSGHKTQPNAAQASAVAVKAGADLDCGWTYVALVDAVKQGQLSESDLDRALVRLFTARFRLGLLDPGQGRFGGIGLEEVNSPAHAALALRAAKQAIVLLKNGGDLLPLKGQGRIAVIGPNAELLQSLEANYNGAAVDPITPLRGMRTEFGRARIAYAPGGPLTTGMRMPVPSSALSGPDGAPGLKAQYWDNPAFQGAPKVSTRDALLNFDWIHAAPKPGVDKQSYSVRWEGRITPPGPGDYVFNFRLSQPWDKSKPSESARLWIDDVLVHEGRDSQKTVTHRFADAKPHRLRIDYVQPGGGGIEPAFAFQWLAPEAPQIEAAVAAARQSDVVVAFVGLSPDLEGEEMSVDFPGFRGGDRTDLALPEAQRRLLEAVKATGKPLVVVSMSGGAIGDAWLAEKADAVIQAWYPGEAGGTAIAQTLAGRNNPSGRLPVTFYRSAADLPPFGDYGMAGRTYRYFAGPVLYPFGHGLSYTRFAYSNARLTSAAIKADEPAEVSVEVRNNSSRPGEEVVQAYVQVPQAPGAPRLQLAGFARVDLKPGEARRVKLTLDPRRLSQVNEKGERRVEAGIYQITLGGGQPGQAAGQTVELKIDGAYVLPK